MTNILDRYSQEHDIRQGTLDQYRWALSSFEKWAGEPFSPRLLTPDRVNSFLAHLRDSGRAPHTIAQRRANLLVIWRWLFEIGETDVAPRRVRVIRRPELPMEVWTPEQVAHLLKHVEGLSGCLRGTEIPRSRFWAGWIRVAWDGALRPCDQRLLKRSQISERFTVVQVKTGRRVTVSLRGETLAELERWYQHHDGPFVWPEKWTASRLRCPNWKRMLRGSGLTGPPKQLRRSSGTEVERQNPGLGWVHLGHSSPSVAARHYVNTDRAYGQRPLPELPE